MPKEYGVTMLFIHHRLLRDVLKTNPLDGFHRITLVDFAHQKLHEIQLIFPCTL